MASGANNAEIAEWLFLAERTVKGHISAIFLKLGVRDRAAAIIRAYDAGIVVSAPDGLRPGSAGPDLPTLSSATTCRPGWSAPVSPRPAGPSARVASRSGGTQAVAGDEVAVDVHLQLPGRRRRAQRVLAAPVRRYRPGESRRAVTTDVVAVARAVMRHPPMWVESGRGVVQGTRDRDPPAAPTAAEGRRRRTQVRRGAGRGAGQRRTGRRPAGGHRRTGRDGPGYRCGLRPCAALGRDGGRRRGRDGWCRRRRDRRQPDGLRQPHPVRRRRFQRHRPLGPILANHPQHHGDQHQCHDGGHKHQSTRSRLTVLRTHRRNGRNRRFQCGWFGWTFWQQHAAVRIDAVRAAGLDRLITGWTQHQTPSPS
ncbi:LuxR C-terminal-related transcriptional regulator [Dactylosporangium fulvum]|uniref:response regulator transcription factor n=1 Tax=Dactylosporangium fulvum TaxID=53359 RepID=UPI003CD08DDB